MRLGRHRVRRGVPLIDEFLEMILDGVMPCISDGTLTCSSHRSHNAWLWKTVFTVSLWSQSEVATEGMARDSSPRASLPCIQMCGIR